MTQVTNLKGDHAKVTRHGETIRNDPERTNKARIPGLNTGNRGSGLRNASSKNNGGGNA